MNHVVLCVLAACTLIVAWNFIPSLREQLRGWTTVLEGSMMAAYLVVVTILDAVQDTEWREIVPQEQWPWILGVFGIWVIFKRVMTHTPVGEKH